MDRTYSHIDLDERRKIARCKLSVDVIAERLEKHPRPFFVNSNAISLTMMRSKI